MAAPKSLPHAPPTPRKALETCLQSIQRYVGPSWTHHYHYPAIRVKVIWSGNLRAGAYPKVQRKPPLWRSLSTLSSLLKAHRW